jgi:hypothetical protein
VFQHDLLVPRHIRLSLGGLCLLGAVLLWQPNNPLWLSALVGAAFVAGAYIATQATFAIYLTVSLWAVVQLLTTHALPPTRWVYLGLAAIGFILTGMTLLRRFRKHIAQTREARWKHR